MNVIRLVSLVCGGLLLSAPVMSQESAPMSIPQANNVVLLHGLARSEKSMQKLSKRLHDNGYQTCNIAYPSRHHPIETLTQDFVEPSIRECFGDKPGPIHFVTHSMGGIITRQLAATTSIEFGRVVMLAPPNHGSEVVDKLGNFGLFEWVNGPAGQQLGTTPEALPNRLGPAPFELGVITGNRSINWILSSLITGDDDGKVAVESAKLDGMRDFLVVPATHPLIMRKKMVAQQVLHFLRHGRFQNSARSKGPSQG